MILIQHIAEVGPNKGEAFYLLWDNTKHQPAPGASFMLADDLRAYIKSNYPGYLVQLKEWMALCADHGTGHRNPIVTPERVFQRGRVPGTRDRLSPELAWDLYGPKKAAAKKKAAPKPKAPVKPKEEASE